MKTKISSSVLAKLEEMFNSGMTFQDVSEALENEVVTEPPVGPSTPPLTQPEPGPESQNKLSGEGARTEPGTDFLPPEMIDFLYGLVSAVQNLGEGVHSLSVHDKVQKSTSLSKVSQNLAASTQSVAELINAINRNLSGRDNDRTLPTIDMNKWLTLPAPVKSASASPRPSARSFSAKRASPISNLAKPSTVPAVQAAIEESNETKLMVPQPKLRQTPPVVAPAPQRQRNDLPVPLATKVGGADVRSKMAAALDQITKIASASGRGEINLSTKDKIT